MLVLQRTANREPNPLREIVIVLEDGREVLVSLIHTQGDHGRLGVVAPKTIQVHRREVWNAIQRTQTA